MYLPEKYPDLTLGDVDPTRIGATES